MHLKIVRILLLNILVVHGLAVAQKSNVSDSLEKLIPTLSDDTIKVKLLNDLAWEHLYTDPTKTLEYANKGLELAEKIKYENGITDSYNTLGNAYYMTADYDKSLDAHSKAAAIREKAKDQRGLIASYSNMGSAYKELGNYPMELKNYLKALSIAESLNDSTRLPLIYNNIGDAYKRQKIYKNAIEYNTKSLSIRLKQNNTSGIISGYINLATVLLEEGKYSEGIVNLEKALALLKTIDDNYQLAKCYTNMGFGYKELGQYDLAMNYLMKAVDLNISLGNKASLCTAYINMAGVYEAKGNYKQAIIYDKKVIEIATEISHNHWKKQGYLGLASVYAKMNLHKEAFEYYQRYSELSEEMINEDFNRQITQMQAAYDSEKKEIQIKELKQLQDIKNLKIQEQQLQIVKRNYFLLAAVSIFLLLVAGGYFFYSRQKLRSSLDKSLAIKSTEEGERIRIAKDIHDELGSGLTKINFLSTTVLSHSDDLLFVKNNVGSISETSKFLIDNMRDLIWALNPENTTLDNLLARIREYSTDYFEEFPITLTSNYPDIIPSDRINKESHRNIFLAVKESLNNIAKHSKATTVQMSVSLDKAHLTISINDNGIGMDTENVSGGNGLRNIKHRVQAAGGVLNIQSARGKGVLLTMTVPLRKLQDQKYYLSGIPNINS